MDQGDALAVDEALFLEQRGQGRRSGALGYVVGCIKTDPSRFHNFGIRNGDDVICIAINDVDRLRIRNSTCQSVDHRAGDRRRHRFACLKRKRVGRSTGRNHAYNFRFQTQRIPSTNGSTDTAPHPDRHINIAEIGNAAKQFECIARDTLHKNQAEGVNKMELRFFREPPGMLERVLEIAPEFDQFSSQTADRGILFLAVSMWHNDYGPETGANTGKSDALTKVAPRSGDDSRCFRIRATKL